MLHYKTSDNPRKLFDEFDKLEDGKFYYPKGDSAYPINYVTTSKGRDPDIDMEFPIIYKEGTKSFFLLGDDLEDFSSTDFATEENRIYFSNKIFHGKKMEAYVYAHKGYPRGNNGFGWPYAFHDLFLMTWVRNMLGINYLWDFSYVKENGYWVLSDNLYGAMKTLGFLQDSENYNLWHEIDHLFRPRKSVNLAGEVRNHNLIPPDSKFVGEGFSEEERKIVNNAIAVRRYASAQDNELWLIDHGPGVENAIILDIRDLSVIKELGASLKS